MSNGGRHRVVHLSVSQVSYLRGEDGTACGTV